MSKKIITVIAIVMFLPAIIAGIWFLSVTGNKLSVSNVSSVILTPAEKEGEVFLTESDRTFFIDLKESFEPIERQEFDEEVYSLYQIDFLRIQGDITYFLCLSADTNNCLAYDVNDNWYRIDKEKAKQFLLDYNITDVYKFSNVPALTLSDGHNDSTVSFSECKWNYLVADGSYKKTDKNQAANTEVTVSSLDDFELFFDIEPDWYGVKIFENGMLVYDGLLDSTSGFTSRNDAKFNAIITAEWYDTTTTLYNGEVTYEFILNYDANAVYSINKNEFNSGEVVYLRIYNADDETFEASAQFLDSPIKALVYTSGQLVVLPVPMDTPTGDYTVTLSSDKSHFNIPVKINARNFETVNVGLIREENPSSYNDALQSFKSEISTSSEFILSECLWLNGCITPLEKYISSVEQYWVSAPSYGVKQTVDGVTIDERNFGIHYVKSVATDSLKVRAIADGVVAFCGQTSAYGNTVVIEHGYGFKSVYGHLDEVNLSVGDKIASGDFFATVKPTGYSIASTELLFAIMVNNEFVNPFNYINEPRTLDASVVSDKIDFLS